MRTKGKRNRAERHREVLERWFSNGYDNLEAISFVEKVDIPVDDHEKKAMQKRFAKIKQKNPEVIEELQNKNEKKYDKMRDRLVNKLDKVATKFEQLADLAIQDELTKEDKAKFQRLKSIMSTKDYNKALELIGKLTGSFEPTKTEITNNYTVSFGEAPEKKQIGNYKDIDHEELD